MYKQLIKQSKHQAFEAGLWDKGIETAFFKCTKWQLEETLDPLNCPYHYYCNSTYHGNYPYFIDILVLIFVTASFLSTLVMTLIEISGGRRQSRITHTRRYVLPSGPISLPIMLLIMAKGSRINTLFPLMLTGPAILHLIRVSALAFETECESDIRYVFLEASTISGLLHAAIYLDSVILPYYTGLDALVSSRFSGECLSCVCRKKALVVGGVLIFYRGWSVTTILVVSSLCLRIFGRLASEIKERTKFMKSLLEGLSWILLSLECVYLMIVSPEEEMRASFVGVSVLICLLTLRRLCTWALRGNRDNEISLL